MSKIFLTSFAAVALACASKPSPITVTGDAGDRASLAGKWSGEYQSTSTGRSGSIVFNLSAAGDSANGDGKLGTAGGSIQNTNNSQVLTIRLVKVSGNTVSGVLDAYRDPQCDCAVETTFTGTLNGNTINGTFSTRGTQANAPQTGTWRVKRT